MTERYSRHIKLDKVINFRDIGGYKTRDGKTVAWRRIFRSGELSKMSPNDHTHLCEKIALNSVLDLRSPTETKQQTCPLIESGVSYYSIPLMTDSGNREEGDKFFAKFTNMGQFYLYFVGHIECGKRIVEALEVVADPQKHPIVFHCALGKDRTGIIAAILLSILGVEDSDIIDDYSLTNPFMEETRTRVVNNPETPQVIKDLPDFAWRAKPESMEWFLNTLRKEYGSIHGYLESMGAGVPLINRLKKALLA